MSCVVLRSRSGGRWLREVVHCPVAYYPEWPEGERHHSQKTRQLCQTEISEPARGTTATPEAAETARSYRLPGTGCFQVLP